MTHGDVRDLIAPYVVGALEAPESVEMEEHLEGCGFCANLAREALEVVHCLPYVAPQRPLPGGALERLLTSISGGASGIYRTSTIAEATALAPAAIEARAPATERKGRRWQTWFRSPSLFPVAAGFILVAGMAAWNVSLERELGSERREMDVMRGRLGQQSHLLLMVTSTASMARPLQGTALAPSAQVRLIMDGESNSAMLFASHLPPLGSNQVYEVWLGRQGVRVPAGTFQVDQQGDGECSLQLDGSIHSYDSAWITAEPARGGPMPNSPGIARGAL